MRRPQVEALEGRQLLAVNVLGVEAVPAGRGIADLIVSFNDDMVREPAQSTANYGLLGLGHDGRVNTHDDHPIRIASAVYDAPSRSVSVMPGEALSRREAYLFRVVGTPPGGLTNTSGEFLDGNGDGSPGDDDVTVLPAGSVPGRGHGTTGHVEFGPAPLRIVTVLPTRHAIPFIPGGGHHPHRIHPRAPIVVPAPIINPTPVDPGFVILRG